MPASRACLIWVRSCLCWGSHRGVGACLHGIKHHEGFRNAPPQPGGDGKLRGGGPSSAPCIFQPQGQAQRHRGAPHRPCQHPATPFRKGNTDEAPRQPPRSFLTAPQGSP